MVKFFKRISLQIFNHAFEFYEAYNFFLVKLSKELVITGYIRRRKNVYL